MKRAGFSKVSYNTSDDWSVMWAHDYPFKKIKPVMMKMNSYQKVNKLPGSGFVTNKVNLATSESPYIPKAFRIPNDTEKLKKYAEENPNTMFVQKNSNHRGIKIEKLDKLDLKSSGSFVQKYVDDPFLIDGYKFDSSYDKGQPLTMEVSRFVPGFQEALLIMSVGSRWEVYIPYNLAYGEQGIKGSKLGEYVVPPSSTLIFEMELLAIVE